MTLLCQAGAPVYVTPFVLSTALWGWALLLAPSYRWGNRGKRRVSKWQGRYWNPAPWGARAPGVQMSSLQWEYLRKKCEWLTMAFTPTCI